MQVAKHQHLDCEVARAKKEMKSNEKTVFDQHHPDWFLHGWLRDDWANREREVVEPGSWAQLE
jgi:hypothetical protein